VSACAAHPSARGLGRSFCLGLRESRGLAALRAGAAHATALLCGARCRAGGASVRHRGRPLASADASVSGALTRSRGVQTPRL
jgi:hypothetical protein